MTHSIDQTLHQYANLLSNWTLLPILTLLPNFGGFQRTLQRMRLANRGRLLLRTPGPVPFGTCICSNVETILSWTCHVYGPFESRTSLGTSILLATCNSHFWEILKFIMFIERISHTWSIWWENSIDPIYRTYHLKVTRFKSNEMLYMSSLPLFDLISLLIIQLPPTVEKAISLFWDIIFNNKSCQKTTKLAA